MQQTIKDRRDDDLIMEELRPVRERLVRCENGARFLVAVGDETVEEIALLPVDGRVAHFVNDHQGGFVIAPPSAGTTRLVIFLELPDEVLHGGEVHAP